MSASDQRLQCRTCNESIPSEADTCPHCGTSVRSTTASIGAIVLGLVVAGAAVTNLGDLWFYGLIGVAVAAAGAALLYDRRRRTLSA